MEKNCEQESFAGPTLMITAMLVSPSIRSDTSLALLKLPHVFFLDLGNPSNIIFAFIFKEVYMKDER
jgi:hypothetical protein